MWGTQRLWLDPTQAELGWGTRVVHLSASEVAGAKLAVHFAQGEADAVAVREGRRGMELEFGQREGAEGFAEASGFAVELRGVAEVLKLAAAAGAEVRARRSGVL